ncbi:MAG: hypothetical protein WCK00_00735 [Deltaproteobacteria bacterium]
MNSTANALLALGTLQVMTHAEEEMVGITSSLIIPIVIAEKSFYACRHNPDEMRSSRKVVLLTNHDA